MRQLFVLCLNCSFLHCCTTMEPSSASPRRRSRRQQGQSAPGSSSVPTSIRVNARRVSIASNSTRRHASALSLSTRRTYLAMRSTARSTLSNDDTEPPSLRRRPNAEPSPDSCLSIAECLSIIKDGGSMDHVLH